MARNQTPTKLQRRRTANTVPNSSGFPFTRLADINPKELDRRIQKALALVEGTAVGRPLRVADIAASLNISPSHLRHLFRRVIGTSPTHYVKLLRLHKAKELLESGFLSVKQIMLAVGFKDESHFVRDFKALWGMTPSQVREPSTRPARNSGQ